MNGKTIHDEDRMEVLADEDDEMDAPPLKPSPTDHPKRLFPEEEDEDILRETNERFVLFPIKYREVCLYFWSERRRLMRRYGRRIKPHRRLSGRQRRWIWDMIIMIGQSG